MGVEDTFMGMVTPDPPPPPLAAPRCEYCGWWPDRRVNRCVNCNAPVPRPTPPRFPENRTVTPDDWLVVVLWCILGAAALGGLVATIAIAQGATW